MIYTHDAVSANKKSEVESLAEKWMEFETNPPREVRPDPKVRDLLYEKPKL